MDDYGHIYMMRERDGKLELTVETTDDLALKASFHGFRRISFQEYVRIKTEIKETEASTDESE